MTMFSSVQPWLDRHRRRTSPRRPLVHLCIERLEDRTVLSPLVYDSGVVNVPIYDLQTSTSTITVPDSYAVGDVDVTLNITHTWDSDLRVTLVAPDGTSVQLFSAVGGSGKNFTNTVLDDQATTAIGTGTAPFTGTFKPAGSLATFIGHNAAGGSWTLQV